jgi:uncharacterized membrane protein YoaK (UPF0700 family)
MGEPATATGTAAAMAMAISGFTLAFLGFDYYALVGATIGAGISVYFTPNGEQSKRRTIAFAALSMLFGAIAGTALVAWSETPKLLMMACLVCAAGMQRILLAALAKLEKS